MRDQFGHDTDIDAYWKAARGHGFDQRKRLAFVARGDNKYIGLAVKIRHLGMR